MRRVLESGRWVVMAVLFWLQTGCEEDFRVCPEVPAQRLEALPQRLSETGLWKNLATGELGPGVREYSPGFALWSDGAEKRRWIRLPPGTRIDSGDMDFWQFPAGTRLWKEFRVDGRRMETRLLEKMSEAPDDWLAVSYAWDAEQTDAVLAPTGGTNVLGTQHDIPAADQCWGCHGGTRSHVLGFSAIQLAHDAPDGELTLRRLMDEGLLTRVPDEMPEVPGTPIERAALGYLHANCGHCHNQARPESEGPRCYDPHHGFDLLLRVDRLGSVSETPTYATAVGKIFRPGNSPENSLLFRKMSKPSDEGGMPPLAKEHVDEEGLALLSEWIESMPGR